MEIGNKLIELRKINKMTQDDVAKQLNIRRQTYSAYERNISQPDATTLVLLAKIFGVSTDEILNLDQARTTQNSSKKIPVIGKIRAGIPFDAIEDIIDYEEINDVMASNGEYFGLFVLGDSMEPRICQGDVVIVRKQSTCQSGDIAVVMINNHDATLKKIVFHSNSIVLIPFNDKYESTIYTKEQIEKLPISILGKVVELRAKF